MIQQDFHIKVISLHGETRRQESAKKQLDELGLNYEIVLFHRLKSIDIPEYDRKKRIRHFGYDLVLGKLGNFKSHRSFWKQAEKESLPSLILEDDFLFTNPKIKEILSLSAELVLKYHFIRLQGCFPTKTRKIKSINKNLNLVIYPHKMPAGTTAYMISPKAGEILYEKSKQFYLPVDDFLDEEYRHKITQFAFIPYPIGTLNAPSTIEEQKRKKGGGEFSKE